MSCGVLEELDVDDELDDELMLELMLELVPVSVAGLSLPQLVSNVTELNDTASTEVK